MQKDIWIEANIKFARDHIMVNLNQLDDLNELTKGKEINSYHIKYTNDLGASFSSVKKFVQLMDNMVLDYYEGIVQHMTNWNKPAPKLERN